MYAQRGWDDLAIESYLEALTLDETLYEAWTNLGTIYNRQENLPQAEKSFRKAIDLQPRAALAYYNLGTVLDRSDRYDEALAAYKTAITYDPTLLDPAVNPQVVNNQHLTSIRLMSYLESAGSGALPLEEFSADMEDLLAKTETGEEETEPPLVVPVGAAVSEPQPGPPAVSRTSSGKLVLGTLHADVKKESRKSRRQRRKQEQATPQAEPGTPAP
jgi:tetratricopeptide (TPR) repeat protein